MINLNINYSLKADATPELNARFVAEFIEALEAKGYTLQGETVKPVKPASIEREKGEHELAWLAQSGHKRMKVPSTWEGTREEWAKKLLANESEVVHNSEESEDEHDILHV
jgi:hypothetical protein